MTGRIIGTGSYVPERIVTNEELAEVVETSDEWIVTRTGIHERRIAETEGTSVLAARAAERALKNANVSAEEVDFILLATSSPDHCFPNGACEVQAAIGAVHAIALISVRHVPDLKSRSAPPRRLSRPVYIGPGSSSARIV